MKKTMIYLLVISLFFSVFAVGCNNNSNDNAGEDNSEAVDTDSNDASEETADEEDAEEEELVRPTEASGQLIIGDSTEMSGDFSGAWQNNAADASVRYLVSGLGTTAYADGGKIVTNTTVVDNLDIKENDDKTKTFTYTIKEGLKFADGEEITAKNYVAGIIFWASPVVGVGYADGKNTGGLDLVGYNDFSTGKTDKFAGVNLIDEKTFSVTVAADKLPDFYELARASAGPESLKFWLGKDIEIKDDGDGAYFAENIVTQEYAQAIKDAKNTNRIPCSGPYKIDDFDTAQKMATLSINENYPGNMQGHKPLIAKVIIKRVDQKTALDDLKTGGVDLIRQSSTGDEINAGLDLVNNGGFGAASYPRSGYGKIAFSCDFGPTQYKEVRQALAHLLDRNDFTQQFTGGFGEVANGPWGDAQWFWQRAKADLSTQLNTYPYDPARAVELLEEAGFTLNESGNAYSVGDGVRYKKLDDGTMMPLTIKWASTDNNEVSDLLVVKLVENEDLINAGIKIERDTMNFPELIGWLYRDGSRDPKYKVPTYGMYNLGTSFTPIYDQKETYSTKPELIEMGYNMNFIFDKELEQACIDMVRRSADDEDGFVENFKRYALKWNELLPDLPLYSNLYHDFYNDKLKNYNPDAVKQLDQMIVESWVE